MPLTAKQDRFVAEYLVDLNATQAAIRAGYSRATAGSVGHENLNKPEIAAAIAVAQQKLSERVEITQEWVIERLVENANRAMQAEPVIIEGQTSGVWKYEGSTANRALELLGKHLGMFKERVEHSGSVDVTEISDRDRARAMLLLAAKVQDDAKRAH